MSKMLPKLFGRHLPAQLEDQEPERDSASVHRARRRAAGRAAVAAIMVV
jgi:hypothetical protein